MGGWMYVCMVGGWMAGWMDGWMDVCMYGGWMCVWICKFDLPWQICVADRSLTQLENQSVPIETASIGSRSKFLGTIASKIS